RKAAYLKLESVQADLVRVNDIVSEVQKAVNSLERQAKKAEQFNEVKTRLKTMEIDLMEREYAHLHARMKPLQGRLASLTQDKQRIDVDLSQEESRMEELRGSLADVERRLAEAQRDVSQHMEKIHRVEEKNLVAAERMKALNDNIVRFETEKEELRAEMQEIESLKVTLEQRILELGIEERRTAEELETKRAELEEAERRLGAKKSELQSLNERKIQLVQDIAEKNSAQDRRKGRVENLHGRSAHAQEETALYESDIVRINGDIAGLTEGDKQFRKLFVEAEGKFYESEERQKKLRQDIDGLQRNEMEIAGEVERRRAKIDFLRGLIESREGLAEGVRFLSGTERWKPRRKITVADSVQADQQFRTAIESALGEFAGLIIVDSQDEAENGIALLKEEQRGKATFVCLDRLPRIESHLELPRIEGVHGWAAGIARYDTEFAPLFRMVLDRILIVDTVETARKVIERFPSVRCVTVDGEMATGVGITKGGSRRQDEGGTIGKQGQIEDLENEIRSLDVKLEGVKTLLASLVHEHDAIDLKVLGDAVKSIEKEMNGVEMRIAQLQFEKKRADDVIAKNNEAVNAVNEEAGVLAKEIADAAPGLAQLENEKADVEQRVGASALELDSFEADWSGRSKVVHDLSIRIATLKGDLQNAQADLHRADETIADIIQTTERRDADIAHAKEDIAKANLLVEENAHLLSGLQEDLSALERRKVGVEDEFTRIREEIHRIELKIKDERRHHDDSLKATHELELKLTDMSGKADHILARAQEEYELSLELKSYSEEEFVDFAALKDEIQAMRDKIKSLGNINFAAFEEYNTEKERFEFLSNQRKDLLEAEKTLLATIEEINTTAQRKFLDTFTQIRVNFIETFKSLFDPGDECDLKLEEGVDPLEAGIEIIAKPRGKRPTSIDLLSGGEKTLTATALLFAIYLVKPSPFCILDEVDAPLDDANVDRFTRILRKFSNNTQFIVVTHNKRTMEAANALYGVTMEEEGISKLVTVRFNQGSEVRSAAVVSS
ncbi:MAG: chromosome segregation protein SMC, partial [Bacteroidota bacterium]